MQATVKGTAFGFGPVKHGIAALGIAAALAIGVVTVSTVERGGSSESVTRQAAVTSNIRSDYQRFVESNLLPEAARQATSDFRFVEMNVLPGDAGTLPVVRQARMLFLEANLLPEAAADAYTQEEMRFWEANSLPGDDQPNVPPSSDNDGGPY